MKSIHLTPRKKLMVILFLVIVALTVIENKNNISSIFNVFSDVSVQLINEENEIKVKNDYKTTIESNEKINNLEKSKTSLFERIMNTLKNNILTYVLLIIVLIAFLFVRQRRLAREIDTNIIERETNILEISKNNFDEGEKEKNE